MRQEETPEDGVFKVRFTLAIRVFLCTRHLSEALAIPRRPWCSLRQCILTWDYRDCLLAFKFVLLTTWG